VATALTVGLTYGLLGLRSPGDKGGTSSTDGAPVTDLTGLTSGKNQPEVPADAYDGGSPQWNLVAAAVQPTVVAIKVDDGMAEGSGVIINSELGHVVTNNHVVADATDIQVILSDGRIYTGETLGTDASTDLAVVKLVNPPSDLAEAQLGDSGAVVVGEPVMAVGNPLGLDNTVTTGIVSALNRPVTTEASGAAAGRTLVVTNAIQVDAAVNPGNSGGPLFNSKGQVIGINTSIAAFPSLTGQAGSIGLAFAIPVNLVADVAMQLIETGQAIHPFLGVSTEDTTVEVEGVTRAGANIIEVVSDTAAAAAGLRIGDVVVAVDGTPITGMTSLTARIRSMRPGDEVSLTVVRDGQATEVKATLAERAD
jgi:putative serine protease PepD